MIKVYGLKNCDTCRKALSFMKKEGIEHRFIDVRQDGISAQDIARVIKAVGAGKLLNKSSTTWRGLDEDEKDNLDQKKTQALMLRHPTLIKRPVFDMGAEIVCGFNDAGKAALKKAAGKK